MSIITHQKDMLSLLKSIILKEVIVAITTANIVLIKKKQRIRKMTNLKQAILQGIPSELPAKKKTSTLVLAMLLIGKIS